MRPWFASSLIAVVAAIGGLGACATTGRRDAASFRVFYPDSTRTGFRATVGKRFHVKPVGECVYANGRDARWSMTGATIAEGTLPADLTLEDGAISGIARRPGTFKVRVRFSGVVCAGRSHEPQLVDVAIVVSRG